MSLQNRKFVFSKKQNFQACTACTALLTLLMITAESMLSKSPVLRFTVYSDFFPPKVTTSTYMRNFSLLWVFTKTIKTFVKVVSLGNEKPARKNKLGMKMS